jgi:DNA-directed RNA polymerase beta' subunit
MKDRTAKQTLLELTKERPVVVDRAPVLHKYGMMAFWPRLVKGDVLHVNPFVLSGYGMDFDGNCLDFDSVVFIKLSKFSSILSDTAANNESDALYVLFVLQLRENIMNAYGETQVAVLQSGGVVPMKIGLFPRVGKPMFDKNGAEVYRVPDGVEVLSYDVGTGEPVFKPVTMYTVEHDVPCSQVTTTGGRSVIISNNESLAAFNQETGCLEKIAPEAARGRLVPVIKHLPFGEEFPVSSQPMNRFDLVPVSKSEAQQAESYISADRDTSVCLKTARNAFNKAKTDGSLPREDAITYLKHLPEDYCSALRTHAAAKDVTWERYETVEPVSSRDVFDLIVQDTKVFVIDNGLVVYDTSNFQVPHSEEALRDTIDLMLPSRNLIDPGENKSPAQSMTEDFILGLYEATRTPKNKSQVVRTFATKEDAMKAYHRGDIGIHDSVKILR